MAALKPASLKFQDVTLTIQNGISAMNDMLLQSKIDTRVLVIGDRRYAVVPSIASERSKFLGALLNGNFSEGSQEEVAIELPHPEHFDNIYAFLLLGKSYFLLFQISHEISEFTSLVFYLRRKQHNVQGKFHPFH